MSVTCPACGEQAVESAAWCEACGADLAAPAPVPACVECGAAGHQIDDGYCGTCGTRQPDPNDDFEVDLGWCAAVTHKGVNRRSNEDAVAIGVVDGTAVLVVCDGVGSTTNPRASAIAAATSARDAVVELVGAGAADDDALIAATKAAQQAVLDATPDESDPGQHPPSSTFVAAVARSAGPAESATVQGSVAWLGDSRAYWLGHDAVQLTDDHIVDHGGGEGEAAGSITRWLGSDAVDVTPSITTFDADGPGHIVVCSDGLWGYAAEAADLASVVESIEGPGEPIALARGLVDFANRSGGRDNISVAVAQWTHSTTPGGQP